MSVRLRLLAVSAAVAVLPVAVIVAFPGVLPRAGAAVTCTSPTTIPASTGAPYPAGNVLAAGNTPTVYDPSGPAIAWQPHTFAADVVTRDATTGMDKQAKEITAVYSSHLDMTNAPGGQTNGALVSADSGGTFSAAAASVPAASLGEVGRLLDGRMLGVAFVANGAVTVSGSQISFPLMLRVSADKGLTWQSIGASTTFTDADLPGNIPVREVSALQGVLAAGKPIEKTNGTVVLPIYFNMSNGKGGGLLFASVLTAHPSFANGSVVTGTPWTFTMHPITSNPTYSFDETAVVERADGSLLEVTRGATPNDTLSYKTSADDGTTWSGIQNVSFADQPGCAVYGVLPQLTLMPNGLLVLSSGRPNNWIAVSTDATGTSWTREQTTYRNTPGGGPWNYGSSGYTSLEPTGVNRLLQFVDNCAAPNGTSGVNGCVSGSGYDHDQQYRILAKQMSALIPDLGRIDIADQVRHGTAQLTTDLTGVPPAGAVTPPTPYGQTPSTVDATSTGYWSAAEGATDGSDAYWAGALSSREDGTGTYQLKLNRSYQLTKIGLELTPGAHATAHVSTSVDGVNWTPTPLGYPTGVTNPGVTGQITTPGDRALRYYTLDAQARYVRVSTDATSCAAVGGPAACSMINELELYSTTDSFENEPAVPHGLTDLACVRVTQPGGNGDPDHDSQYALRLKDGTDATYCDGASTLGRFTYPGPGVSLPAAGRRTLDASVYEVSNTHGILFNVNGVRGSDGATVVAYHMGISSGGRWMAYTTAGGWVVLGGDAVPLKTWTRLRVTADTMSATLSIVDASGAATVIGTVPRQDAVTFSSLAGYAFTSGSTTGTGDEAVIDDITFE